jgi:hypothetical protein
MGRAGESADALELASNRGSSIESAQSVSELIEAARALGIEIDIEVTPLTAA